MEWVEALKEGIDYIEMHLLEDIGVEEVAEHIYLSPFYFQRGFKIITGYSVGEYIRNRRLYLAALELRKDDIRVIDLAYQYGYDTPESFTKAFTRFHGISPMQLKEQTYKMKVFHPLQLSFSIKGGGKLEYEIEKMDAFKIIGIEKTFRYEKAFDEIPLFWKQYQEIQQASSCIGMYGISIAEDTQCNAFRYLIAGPYSQAEMTLWRSVKGIKSVTIPALTWAKFKCIGPMPQALQALNTRIFKEWLPGNYQYGIAVGYNVELYTMGDTQALDYVSEIWIPVKNK